MLFINKKTCLTVYTVYVYAYERAGPGYMVLYIFFNNNINNDNLT